jgi:hypothetical protein
MIQRHSNKNSMIWHINRHSDQWDRIEDPDIKLHNYNHVTFEKGAKDIQKRKGSLFNKWYQENWLYR